VTAGLTLCLTALLGAVASSLQPEKSPEPRTLTYATRNGADLVLDLYLPVKPIRRPTPVIVALLIVHGLADSSVPHGQSVLLYELYEALTRAGQDVTLRLIDGLPHTFFNRTDLDEVAGPFRMQVREHPRGGPEARRVETAGAFAVARAFFTRHLR
jgi:dipeptidyl aminopeptidase/acylaminoacyl peptidase